MTTGIKILPFVLVFAAIFFGGHYLLYYSSVKFFGITNSTIKLVLLVSLVLLLFSFIAASILARVGQNSFVSFFYAGSASWIGLALNFLLAVLVIWFLLGVAGLAGFHPNNFYIRLFAVIMFSVFVCFSAYGFLNAFNIRIKNVEIGIKNLPGAWGNKKIIQFSDAHLGRIIGVKFFNKVVDKINAEHPDIVFITGDLFDGMDGKLDVFTDILNRIQAKDGIFFVTGNHEIYLGKELTGVLLGNTKIKILNDEMVEVDGVQIVGLSYRDEFDLKNRPENIKSIEETVMALKDPDLLKPSILLFHAPVNTAQIRSAGINLQLSGHTHAGQIFPVNYIERLVYGKYYRGLHKEGDYNIFTSDGLGTWGPPMRTGSMSEIVVLKLHSE